MQKTEHDKTVDDGGLFLGLPSDVATQFASLSRRRRLADGELLYARGDVADALFGLIQGQLRLSNVAPDGREVLVMLGGPGDWLGDVSLFDGLARTHNAYAMGECEVFVLPKAKLQALLDVEPQLYRHFVTRLARALRFALSYIDDAALLPLTARLAKRLLDLARMYGEDTPQGVCVDLHLTQEDLGRMLGASRQSISKELNRFQKQGWLELQYGKVVICDQAPLQRLVEQPSVAVND